jgi:CBS domain containing-hemolysin-like protein
MSALLAVIAALVAISFLCSLLESIILSVTEPFIHTLVEEKKRSGAMLAGLKGRINDPISAILTLNTISNTAGAAVAGGIALRIFGSQWMAAFSAALTLTILIFSEIIPKTLGATYWKQLAPAAAWVLRGMVLVLKPITVPVNTLAGLISRGDAAANVSKAEVYNAVRLGYLQGVIESSEFEVMGNMFMLKETPVRKIMTPRTVVFAASPDQTAGSVLEGRDYLQFSRIPIYDQKNNEITGIVLRRDIILEVAQARPQTLLKSIAQKPVFVPESISVFFLLQRLVKERVHLVAVINEFGDYTGIVTMEDAIETLLGLEIVDESDRVVDMRELAKRRMIERFQHRGFI